MHRRTFDGPFQVVTTGVPAGAQPGTPAAGRAEARLVLSGYAGPALPQAVTAPVLARRQSGGWRLVCREGTYDLAARGVEVQVPEPGLFDELLAPFALRRRERFIARALLTVLGLPGVPGLLRAWHAGRR